MGSIFVPELGFIWDDEMSPAHRTPARNNYNPSARNIRPSARTFAQVTRLLTTFTRLVTLFARLLASCIIVPSPAE